MPPSRVAAFTATGVLLATVIGYVVASMIGANRSHAITSGGFRCRSDLHPWQGNASDDSFSRRCCAPGLRPENPKLPRLVFYAGVEGLAVRDN